MNRKGRPFQLLQIFAAVGSLQAVSGFAGPLYNILYLQTKEFYLGTAYLAAIAFIVLLLLILLYCLIIIRRRITTKL